MPFWGIPEIVVTARGSVLAYCEARRTGKSDWDASDVGLRLSVDGGKIWSPRQKIANVPGPQGPNPGRPRAEARERRRCDLQLCNSDSRPQ